MRASVSQKSVDPWSDRLNSFLPPSPLQSAGTGYEIACKLSNRATRMNRRRPPFSLLEGTSFLTFLSAPPFATDFIFQRRKSTGFACVLPLDLRFLHSLAHSLFFQAKSAYPVCGFYSGRARLTITGICWRVSL